MPTAPHSPGIAELPGGRGSSSRLGSIAGSLFRHSRAVSSDFVLLAVLDARSAAIRFAWMLAFGVAGAILLVTAWLALVAGAIVWMLGSGASWITALLVAAVLNVVVAGLLAYRVRSLFSEPPFAATIRQLRGEDGARDQWNGR